MYSVRPTISCEMSLSNETTVSMTSILCQRKSSVFISHTIGLYIIQHYEVEASILVKSMKLESKRQVHKEKSLSQPTDLLSGPEGLPQDKEELILLPALGIQSDQQTTPATARILPCDDSVKPFIPAGTKSCRNWHRITGSDGRSASTFIYCFGSCNRYPSSER